MLQFLSNHIEVVDTFFNVLLVVIWAVYLQIFLISHLRQSRSVLHIDIGAARGPRRRGPVPGH